MTIFVYKENPSWRNAIFKQMYQFWKKERGWCKNNSVVGFANELILNRIERQQMTSNIDFYYYPSPQKLTVEHFKMSINGASMIFSLASWVIRPPIDCK